MYYGGGGGSHSAQGPPLIPCGGGGRGGREHPPLTHIQSNARRFLFLLFIYLRFAEAASFDKKSYAGAIQKLTFSMRKAMVFFTI